MTRLLKFMQRGYTVPDYVNPEYVRSVVFSDTIAAMSVGREEFTLTHDEAHRIIAEINRDFDFALPSPVEENIKVALADDILKANARMQPRLAPEQPIVNLGAFLDVLRADNYLVLDTETTGLEDGEIVQIAIVHSSGKVLLDTYVKPKLPIPADATAIHGITDDMVKYADFWISVRDKVYECIKGQHVVIYNAVYDRKMMHKSSERWGLPKTEWKEVAAFWCAMEMFAEVYGNWNDYRGNYRWQKLSTAAAHYGIEQTEAHTALADCLTTLAVCKAMAGA